MLEQKNLNFEQDFINRRMNKSFLDTAMNTHDEINRLTDKDLFNFYENIDVNFHRSYYQFMANHKLNTSTFLTLNQRFMINNLRLRQIHTFGELKIFKENNFSLDAH